MQIPSSIMALTLLSTAMAGCIGPPDPAKRSDSELQSSVLVPSHPPPSEGFWVAVIVENVGPEDARIRLPSLEGEFPTVDTMEIAGPNGTYTMSPYDAVPITTRGDEDVGCEDLATLPVGEARAAPIWIEESLFPGLDLEAGQEYTITVTFNPAMRCNQATVLGLQEARSGPFTTARA